MDKQSLIKYWKENNICSDNIIKAFRKIGTNYKCVIVGNSVYEDRYKNYLIHLAGNDKRIIFTGFLSGQDYEEICSSSALYIETKEVGGTHPSLLEAAAFGNPVIAKNINFHREVLGENAWYYADVNDLAKKINSFLHNKTPLTKRGFLLKEAVKKNYLWKKVIRQYEELFSNE